MRTLPKKYQGLKRRNEHLPDPSRINSPSTSQLLPPSLSSSLPQKSAKSRMLGSRYRRHGPSQEHRGWFTAAQRQPGWNIRSSRAACFSNFVLLSLEKKKRIRKERERKRKTSLPVITGPRYWTILVSYRGTNSISSIPNQPSSSPPPSPSRLLTSRETTRHPRSYRKVFAVLGGSDGSSIVAGWSVTWKEVRGMLIRILWFIDGAQRERDGDSQGMFRWREGKNGISHSI